MGLTLTAFLPPGMIKPHAGGIIPQGYLGCDGAAISRTIYAALFGAIGTTFGIGDGSSTFNLPDLRGRVPVGDGTGSGLSTRNRGDIFGTESHTLSSSNLPTHTHGVGTFAISNTDLTNHSHSTTITTGASNQSLNHNHQEKGSNRLDLASGGGVHVQDVDNTSFAAIFTSFVDLTGHSHTGSGTSGSSNSSLNHSHALSGSSDNGGFLNSSVVHSPPSLCIKYVIRY